MNRILALVVTLMTLSLLSSLSYSKDIIIDDEFRSQPLGEGLRYWLATSHDDRPPPLSSPLWQTSESTLTFGFDQRQLWVTFRIQNYSSDTARLVLDIQYPLLDVVGIEFRNGNPSSLHLPAELPTKLPTELLLGDTVEQTPGLPKHPHLIAPFDLPVGSSVDVVMRIHTEATLNVPMILWDNLTFIEQTQKSIAYYVFLYGILIGIALYHLVLFIQVKETGFLWFSLFLMSLVSVFAYFQGFLTTYVTSDYQQYNNQLLVWGYALTACFCGMYILRILSLRRTQPGHTRSVYFMMATGVVLIVAAPFTGYDIMIRVLTGYAIMSVVIVFSAQIRRALDGFEPAYYATLAGAFCVAGMVVTLFEKTGMVTSTFFTRSAGDLGFTLMAMMYALSLSQRMKWEQSQRRLAQRRNLEVQAELLSTQTQLNKELDSLVQDRTKALEDANEKLKKISITDPLTGLANRRHFDETFYQAYTRALNSQSTLALLLIDIDHFKRINDQYGHPFGDACLVQISERIDSITREYGGIAARYGGEEFIVILPGKSLDEAELIARSIMRLVREQPVAAGDQSARITASIGVHAEIPERPERADKFIDFTDKLLYEAKRQGRDRIISSSQQMQPG